MSVQLKIHSLLEQWFRRFGVSPGAWVSFLTFWCFDRFGVSQMSVLSQPSAYDIATLPTFFYHCFLAWIALGGSLSGGELVVGASLVGGPSLVSNMTTRTCYDLLLSRNPALHHCVGKFLPFLGAWEWCSTWCSLFFMPLDRQVIDLNWKLAHVVLSVAGLTFSGNGQRMDVWTLSNSEFDLYFYIAIGCFYSPFSLFFMFFSPVSFFLSIFSFSFLCSIILCCKAGFDSPPILAGRPR